MISRKFLAASAVAAAAIYAAPNPASAQTGAGLLLEPFPENLTLDANGFIAFNQSGHVERADDSIRLTYFETEGRVRLKPGDMASPRFGYSFTYVDLDTNFAGLPQRLVDQSVGFAMPIGQWDDWIVGVGIGLGYAGDGGFGDGDAWYGKATVAAYRKLDEDSALVFVLDYDGNRTFLPDVPLPGIAYTKSLPGNILLTLGLPYSSVEWKPNDNFRIELGYQLLDDVRLKAGYILAPSWELFAQAGQRTDGFFLDGLDDGHDRLLFEQRRAEVGITYHLHEAAPGLKDVEFTAALGYAWSGEFSTGFDLRETDLVADISDEPYFRIGVRVKY